MATRMLVTVVTHPSGLLEHLAAWQELAEHAFEPNVFYEPWMLMPALESFGAGKEFCFVLIYRSNDDTSDAKLLCGFFPFERLSSYRQAPLSILTLWKHIHCFLCSPLIRSGFEAESMAALFDWFSQEPQPSTLVEFKYITESVGNLLVELLNQRTGRWCRTESFTRALFRPAADSQAFIAGSLSARRRKDLRRESRRLSQTGEVQFVEAAPESNAGEWIEQFLHLEASGWKGRQGTAMLQHTEERVFFTEMIEGGFRRGRVMLLSLTLDGRPVAQKCNLMAPEGSFAFKIAFDEGFASCSPGLLLEIENIRRLHQCPRIRWMDSCAVTNHFMINRLWNERRTIETLLISTGRLPGNLAIWSLPLLKRINRLRLRISGARIN